MQIQSLGQEDPLEESNPLWQPTPVFLPGEFHWQRSLAGYSPWGRQQLDTTEAIQHTHTHTSSLMLCHIHYHERKVSDLCPLICCRASLPCCHSLRRRYSKLQIGSEWHFRDSPSSSIISSSFLIWTCCYRSGLDNPAFSSVQFSRSVVSDSLRPMNHSTPGFPVHHQLLELTQTHVHRVGDAIQPTHALSSPSPSAFNLSQHQGLFKWVSSSHQVAKVLEFQLQHQSFQWIFRTDFL